MNVTLNLTRHSRNQTGSTMMPDGLDAADGTLRSADGGCSLVLRPPADVRYASQGLLCRRDDCVPVPPLTIPAQASTSSPASPRLSSKTNAPIQVSTSSMTMTRCYLKP